MLLLFSKNKLMKFVKEMRYQFLAIQLLSINQVDLKIKFEGQLWINWTNWIRAYKYWAVSAVFVINSCEYVMRVYEQIISRVLDDLLQFIFKTVSTKLCNRTSRSLLNLKFPSSDFHSHIHFISQITRLTKIHVAPIHYNYFQGIW